MKKNKPQHMPFIWYGGKRLTTHKIWERLGDVKLYIEPFCGSAAVAVSRPTEHENSNTIINDMNSYVINFYRAVKNDPKGVISYCADPRSEIDMHARHRWLIQREQQEDLKKLRKDPDYYNLKIAGWWVYGINMWIGNEWCKIKPPREKTQVEFDDSDLIEYEESIYSRGESVNKPINMKLGIHRVEYEENEPNGKLLTFLRGFANKFRYARILSGDWLRCFTKSEFLGSKCVGVFLDPPYDGHNKFYSKEAGGRKKDACSVLNDSVRDWCVEHTKYPNVRIVLSGFGDDNDILLDHGWDKIQIGKEAGMKSQSRNGDTRRVEFIWCSPSCVKSEELCVESEEVLV